MSLSESTTVLGVLIVGKSRGVIEISLSLKVGGEEALIVLNID
jgi:hypothetical protein